MLDLQTYGEEEETHQGIIDKLAQVHRPPVVAKDLPVSYLKIDRSLK